MMPSIVLTKLCSKKDKEFRKILLEQSISQLEHFNTNFCFVDIFDGDRVTTPISS